MTFARRIFAAIFVTNLVVGSLLIYSAYSFFQAQAKSEFEARYRNLSRVLADTLNRLDVTTETMMQNAALVIAEQDNQNGLLSTDELRGLRSRLGVSHAFIVGKNGDFIRSTNEDPAIIPNLFSFSDEYRKLLSGEKLVEATPMIVPKPERIPFKFLSVANADRTRIIEVGVRVDFLANILTEAVKSDESVLAMTLYSPDGTQFGTFSSESSIFREQKEVLPSSFDFPLEATDTMSFFTRVVASHESCAQCDVAGTSINGAYYYILKSEVSKKPLKASQTLASQVAAAFLLVNTLGSLFIAWAISKKLSRNIGLAVQSVRSISAGGDISARVRLHDDSEISYLTNEFDRLLDSLETAQEQTVAAQAMQAKVELAKVVAHNIRSPIVAIEMVLGQLHEVRGEFRRSLNASVNEIKELSDQLNRGSNADILSATRLKIGSVCINEIVDEVIRQKRIERVGEYSIDFDPSNSAGLFVLSNRQSLKAVFSNLINNSLDSLQSTEGRIKIRIFRMNSEICIEIEDNGSGISRDMLGKLGNESVSTKVGVGHGIGVMHAKQVAEESGGALSFRSDGRGTTVKLTLPQAAKDVESDRLFVGNA